MEELPSHFNWNLEKGTCKEFYALEHQMLEYLKYTKSDDSTSVAGYLFLSFLYMSMYTHQTPDPKNAQKYLVLAYDKIGLLEGGNESAWLGYLTVAKANEAHIKSKLSRNHHDHCKQILMKEVKDLVRKKTVKSEAYVTATRAFALSRLGIPKYTEAKKYYRDALSVEPNNVSWLFRLALIVGRENRYFFGNEQQKLTPEMLEEKRLYQKVIRLDPNHSLARPYLAHLIFKGGDLDIALEYWPKAVEFGESNPSVIILIGDIYRWSNKYEQALEVYKKYEDNGTKSSRLYHHWGLVYLDQSKDNAKNNSSACALEAIKFFEKALDCKPTNFEALLDRARTYVHLMDFTAAENDFEKLIAMPGTSEIDEIKINCHYGLFLQTAGKREIDAMDRYRTTIECAIEFTEKDGKIRNVQSNRFIGIIKEMVEKAVKNLGELVQIICAKTSVSCVKQKCFALKHAAWLQNVYYGQTSAAIKMYEECLELSKHNTDLIDQQTHVGTMEALFECFIQNRSWAKAEKLTKQMKESRLVCAKKCAEELCISQGQQALLEKNFPEARLKFTEALNNVDAVKGLLLALQRSPKQDTYSLQFRQDCAKLIFRCKAPDVLEVEDSLLESGNDCGAGRHHDHNSVLDCVEDMLDLNDHNWKLWKKYLRMELDILELGDYDANNQCILGSASDVLGESHGLLDRIMADFKARHYPCTGPNRCKYYYSPMTEELNAMQSAERVHLVKKDMLNKLEKSYKWTGFPTKFPDLFEYLVKMQPAYDVQNNWIRAVAKLDNMAKHQNPIREAYYDIPRYLDIKNGDHPIPVCKSRDSDNDETKTTPAEIATSYDRYRVIDLARQAAIGVECIIDEFSKHLD